MDDRRLRLAIIIGSTRRGRFGPTVARWFETRARQHGGFDVDVVDLADAQLPAVLNDYDDQDPEPVRELAPRLAAAEAFVAVTPEYNHSFPGSLKTAIDWYFDEWQAKPVGFVSYGGTSGGLRSVEQLRLVFAEVHAMTIRETVSFNNYPDQFGSDGEPIEPAGANQAAKKLLDQLGWWGHALRNHRALAVYSN